MIEPGTAVRFTGGKYNGFQATAAKVCDAFGSFVVSFEGKPVEVIEALSHVTPLAAWLADKTDVARALSGNPSLQ